MKLLRLLTTTGLAFAACAPLMLRGQALTGSSLDITTDGGGMTQHSADDSVRCGTYITAFGTDHHGEIGTYTDHPFGLFVNNHGNVLQVETSGMVTFGEHADGGAQSGKVRMNKCVVNHNVTGGAEDVAFRINRAGIGTVVLCRTFDAGGDFNLELFEGNAYKPGGGAWGVVSDQRLKKNIEPLTGSLDQLMKLRPVTFEYKDPAKVHQFAGTQTGFIAQEVEKVIPEWVSQGADGYKVLTIRGFESMAVQALRDLRAEKDAQIKKLTAENAALAEKLAALEPRLTRLEHAIEQHAAASKTKANAKGTELSLLDE